MFPGSEAKLLKGLKLGAPVVYPLLQMSLIHLQDKYLMILKEKSSIKK